MSCGNVWMIELQLGAIVDKVSTLKVFLAVVSSMLVSMVLFQNCAEKPSSGSQTSQSTTPTAQSLCTQGGGYFLKPAPSAPEQCFRVGDSQGVVTLMLGSSSGEIIACQFPDQSESAALNLTDKVPVYCEASTKMPCCRAGFKRGLLGAVTYTGENQVHKIFTCHFVGPGFCHEPTQNGCDCN